MQIIRKIEDRSAAAVTAEIDKIERMAGSASFMTYTIRPIGQFKKDLKKIQKRGYNISLLTSVVKLLAEGKKLPEKNRDH